MRCKLIIEEDRLVVYNDTNDNVILSVSRENMTEYASKSEIADLDDGCGIIKHINFK